MNQTSLLQHIFDAKKAHLRWVKRAKHLVEGLPVDKEFIPLKSDSCLFGRWLYTEGNMLHKIPRVKRLMKEIEVKHNELHEVYQNIYEIFFLMPSKKSILQKFFTFNYHNVSPREKEEAQIYFTYLQHASKELMDVLTQLEKIIKTFSYHELKIL